MGVVGGAGMGVVVGAGMGVVGGWLSLGAAAASGRWTGTGAAGPRD